MTDTPRVFLAAYHDGLSPRYEVVPEGAMGAEPWVPEGAGVRVKALIFSDFQEGGCIGRPHPFQYFITQAHNGLFLCHWDETWHSTLTGAQANAQADYQRAAIELTTEPEPTSGAYDLICCTAEDVATGRGFSGDAAADLAMAQESLRDCLEQLGWRG